MTAQVFFFVFAWSLEISSKNEKNLAVYRKKHAGIWSGHLLENSNQITGIQQNQSNFFLSAIPRLHEKIFRKFNIV